MEEEDNIQDWDNFVKEFKAASAIKAR